MDYPNNRYQQGGHIQVAMTEQSLTTFLKVFQVPFLCDSFLHQVQSCCANRIVRPVIDTVAADRKWHDHVHLCEGEKEIEGSEQVTYS